MSESDESLQPALQRLFQQLDEAQRQPTAPEAVQPLPADWLFLPDADTAPWPYWLHLCRCLMLGQGTAPGSGEAAWLRGHITSRQLKVDTLWLPGWGQPSLTHRPLSPARVAQLAAFGLQQDEGIGRSQLQGFAPVCLEEDLLRAALDAGTVPPPRLRFVQPVVSALLRSHGYGALTEVQLWRHDEAPAQRPADAGRLVRAPMAALVPLDEQFAEGLTRVQALLDILLRPGAPAVSWCMRPLKELGAKHAPHPLPALLGPSATATLSLGCLVLLRDHVRDPQHDLLPELLAGHAAELAQLKAALYDCQPTRAIVSAALGDWPAPGAATPWPPLRPVGGVTHKLGVTVDVSPQYGIRCHYYAQGQDGVGVDRWHPPVQHLGELVQRVADDTSDLSPAARLLHAQLVDPHADEAALDPQLLKSVAAGTSPTSLRGYLLWRYAVHAAGEHQPLGPPVRLHRHFVHLHLRDKQARRDTAAGPPPELPRDEDPHLRRDLATLLQDDEFRDACAWSIEAAPYAGKTTLLCEWEMRCARNALRQHHQDGRSWGDEICLLLPVGTLAQALRDGRGSFEERLLAWMQGHAPGLPPIDQLLRGEPTSPDEAPPRLRLLFDALDELQAPTPEERRRIERALCTWLAAPGRAGALPPVFTVREQERAGTLDVGHWQPRRVDLLTWRPSDMRSYLLDRLAPGLHPGTEPAAGSPAAQLLQVLGLSATADAAQLDRQPLNSMASFCATPGILSAQCTLIQTWPGRRLPERRAELLLALVAYSLHRSQHRDELQPEAWLPQSMRQWLQDLHTLDDWRLPPHPGGLLQGLARVADAMQDDQGGRTTVLPLDKVFDALAGPDAQGWWQAVRATGLAYATMDRPTRQWQFRFVHPQFQELFAALGLQRDRLPKLHPPDLEPPTEQALADSLKSWRVSFDLPQVTPHHERVCMAVAVALSHERAAWLRCLLLAGNLPLAARAGIEAASELEPQGAFIGKSGRAPQRELQHLRRTLLLRSMDAGKQVRERLRAGNVVGEDDTQAALAEHMAGFDDELDALWAQEWQHFCSGQGRDIRHRIEAGLLLGELGDNLRYEYVSGTVQGWPISGLYLKPPHWLWRGQPGNAKRTSYRIGSDGGGDDDERPSWTVELRRFQTARYAVSVQEWQHFMASGGYEVEAPWWVTAGPAAQGWLRDNGGRQRQPWRWGDARYTNPLQPVVGITVFEAIAYAAWADALDAVAWLQRGLDQSERQPLTLPTEVLWEAGVQGPDLSGPPRLPGWAHGIGTRPPGLLDFNHDLYQGRSAPIGCYSLGSTSAGLFDVQGNTWEWCSNVCGFEQRRYGWNEHRLRLEAQKAAELDDRQSDRSLRGGAFNITADQCRASYRNHHYPSFQNVSLGLRLVRAWPPHPEP
ncbi:formylglycine-generating enzyme family protein [Ideonella sp. 4Y16]|uniref:SUMF1/EgtB/PvdO family nonheme iron enzyme n=1 Tax=Ideonella alba TaxID=2824118 RepID=UPI001B375C31|nr:SUMF1/EgtB/PvdO family nonheme iron enzyme [Ideonella alba]MBQ0942236.1 formylglycine-generating enzyme family protein [Ideonella alba]